MITNMNMICVDITKMKWTCNHTILGCHSSPIHLEQQLLCWNTSSHCTLQILQRWLLWQRHSTVCLVQGPPRESWSDLCLWCFPLLCCGPPTRGGTTIQTPYGRAHSPGVVAMTGRSSLAQRWSQPEGTWELHRKEKAHTIQISIHVGM